jgi:NTP pyrophosphatase (non-canonical NTP hydrolase)
MNSLTFNKYTKHAESTAADFEHTEQPWYVALGLCGESGEVADALKKIYREFGSVENAPAQRKQHVLRELGDVLWYLNRMATVLGSSLDEVAQLNIDKLSKRKKTGSIIDMTKRSQKDV